LILLDLELLAGDFYNCEHKLSILRTIPRIALLGLQRYGKSTEK
jgi:hypothetical protein